MKHIVPQIFSGEQCNTLEEDWLGPDPWPAPTYECAFCGDEVDSDHIREYVKDVDGSQGMVCIDCLKHGVLELYTPRGR